MTQTINPTTSGFRLAPVEIGIAVFLSVFIGVLVWTERLRSLVYLVPMLLVFGGYMFANRWEKTQPSRLVARHCSSKAMFGYLFGIILLGIAGQLCFPELKIAQGVVVVFGGLFSAGRDYRRYSRWVPKKPGPTSA